MANRAALIFGFIALSWSLVESSSVCKTTDMWAIASCGVPVYSPAFAYTWWLPG